MPGYNGIIVHHHDDDIRIIGDTFRITQELCEDLDIRKCDSDLLPAADHRRHGLGHQGAEVPPRHPPFCPGGHVNRWACYVINFIYFTENHDQEVCWICHPGPGMWRRLRRTRSRDCPRTRDMHTASLAGAGRQQRRTGTRTGSTRNFRPTQTSLLRSVCSSRPLLASWPGPTCPGTSRTRPTPSLRALSSRSS